MSTRPGPGGRPGRRTRLAGVISLGCSKNLVDTEFILGALRRAGWGFTADLREADLALVNTCAFLETAVEESRAAVAEALQHKEQRGGAVVVAGCLVNRFGESLERDFPGVDLFLTPGQIPRFGDWLALRDRPKRLPSPSRGFRPGPGLDRARTTGAWAYLKVADGCDNRCAYCLIPEIRGAHLSRRAPDVLGEARRLTREGVAELDLVAQDLTRWRGGGGRGLSWLVARLAAEPGEFRVRLLYLHPSRVTDELIRVMAFGGKVLPYADVPIQHASDRVLRTMGRGTTRRDLAALLGRLRRGVPGIALRTTVMVGHPGEGRREFLSLMAFLRDHPFENLGAFVFSPQEGTPASRLPDRPRAEEAEERWHLVMQQQVGLSRGLWAARVGSVTEALVLGSGGGRGTWAARSAWQAPEVDGAMILKGAAAPGTWVRALVTGHRDYDLRGRVVGGGFSP